MRVPNRVNLLRLKHHTQFHSVDKGRVDHEQGMEDARNPERPYAVRFRGEIMPKRWTSMIPAAVEREWIRETNLSGAGDIGNNSECIWFHQHSVGDPHLMNGLYARSKRDQHDSSEFRTKPIPV